MPRRNQEQSTLVNHRRTTFFFIGCVRLYLFPRKGATSGCLALDIRGRTLGYDSAIAKMLVVPLVSLDFFTIHTRVWTYCYYCCPRHRFHCSRASCHASLLCTTVVTAFRSFFILDILNCSRIYLVQLTGLDFLFANSTFAELSVIVNNALKY